MAQGKKSFVAYSDWDGMFQALPDEVAGKLIKHVFSYVNDRNPTSEDYIINALFEQVKSTLKRDLKKWEEQREQRSLAGKKSAENRSTKINERSTPVENIERKSTVSVNDNVNVTVNVNDNNRNTLSHEKVVSETVDNEIFCEQSAMTLKADYNVFVAFISERLDEMKITGHSSKYPLGTIKNILIQDFKLNREKEKRSAKKENYGKSTSPTIGRTNEDAIKKFITDNRI